MCQVAATPLITQAFLVWLHEVTILGYNDHKLIPVTFADELKTLYDKGYSPDVAYLYIKEKFVN